MVELVCPVYRIVTNEFPGNSSEKANRLEVREGIQVLFVFFFNSAVLHPLSLVAICMYKSVYF